MFALDHITVAASNVEEGVCYVEQALGVRAPMGGSHPLMGTRNHLMQLDSGEFLEIISRDPDIEPQRARWFGLDDPDLLAELEQSPRLCTWVVRVQGLKDKLERWPEIGAEAVEVTRGDLRWLISVPEDGSMPFDGAFPTLIQWPSGPHPSERMADLGCALTRFEISHPKADLISDMLKSLGLDDERVELLTGPFGFRAMIQTPNGVRILT